MIAERSSVPKSILILISCLIVCCLLLMSYYYYGAVHDYAASYLPAWQAVTRGENPWITPQGTRRWVDYGPGFFLLSPLVLLKPLAPKMMFVFCWIAIGLCFYALSLRKISPLLSREFVLFLFFLNPFFWIEVLKYGHMDILVAAISLAALYFTSKKQHFLSGMSLGLAISIKYFPVIFLPFLAFHKRRVHLRFLAGLCLVIIVSFGLVYFLWGDSFLLAVTRQVSRPPKLLSLARFLSGEFSPYRLDPASFPFGGVSLGAIILANAAILYGYVRGKIDRVSACLLACLSTFTFHHVGHPQYLTVFLVLFPFWLIGRHSKDCLVDKAKVWFVVYAVWLSLYVTMYDLFGEFRVAPFSYMRDLGGLPNFILSIICLIAILKTVLGTERHEA